MDKPLFPLYAAPEKTSGGRGAAGNPPNRFDRLHQAEMEGENPDFLGSAESVGLDGNPLKTLIFRDHSRTLLNRVQSPDLPMSWTANPYRGCEHGCIYCYARPTHEMLGHSCGLDFETRIYAKTDAPQLLRKELMTHSWHPEPIHFSGVTDCYQPVESRLKLTRQCLQVLVDLRQPVRFITKSRLILRDLDLLSELAALGAVQVSISLTTLSNTLASRLEPRASSPSNRLWTIRRLASAGIPVQALVAPVIPALNDVEIPALLKAASEAGARSAAYVLLRLPHQVKSLFTDWLKQHVPQRRDHVLNRLRELRGGELYESNFGTRMTGRGLYARHLADTFKLFARRHGLDPPLPPLNASHFRRPPADSQMRLFDPAS